MVSISSQTGLQPDEIPRRTFPAVAAGSIPRQFAGSSRSWQRSYREVLDHEQSLRKRLSEAEQGARPSRISTSRHC